MDDVNITYAEYISENMNRCINYSEYIAEKNISYAEYIAENLSSVLKTSKEIAEEKRKILRKKVLVQL